jgi:FixJ family two-component response regulator
VTNPTVNEADALATLRIVPAQIEENSEVLKLLRKRRNDAILYLVAQDWSDKHIAENCGLSDVMVGKIRKEAARRAQQG